MSQNLFRAVKLPTNFGSTYVVPQQIAAIVPEGGTACQVHLAGGTTITLSAEQIIEALNHVEPATPHTDEVMIQKG